MPETKPKFIKSLRQDTFVFIDGANLYYAQKHLKFKIDYLKLFQTLKQYHRTKEIFIYLAINPQEEKEKQFLQKLIEIGYKVIKKPLKLIKTQEKTYIKKGNIDIELALDAFEQKNKFRTIILFSGDSDFDILLKKLKQKSKRCIIFGSKQNIGKELFETAHRVFFLENLKSYIQKNPGKPGSRSLKQKT